MSLWGEEVLLMIIKGLNMFWKDTQNYYIPHMMMTLKGRFIGKKSLVEFCSVDWSNQKWNTNNKVDYLDDILLLLSGEAGNYIYCLLDTTGKSKILEIITLCSKICWGKVKICDLSYSPQDYQLYISVWDESRGLNQPRRRKITTWTLWILKLSIGVGRRS